MNRFTPTVLLIATALSAATVGTWLATGRHVYTKFEVVETVRTPPDPGDPFAGTGFYEDEMVDRTVTRDEFHLGLIPTPQRLLDRHALSVGSILAPIWGFALLTWFRSRRWRQLQEVNE